MSYLHKSLAFNTSESLQNYTLPLLTELLPLIDHVTDWQSVIGVAAGNR